MLRPRDIDMRALLTALGSVSSMESVACDCPECRAMCHKAPCIGTPEEMLRIAEAGYADKLCSTLYAPFVLLGVPPVELVAPVWEKDRCAFLDACGHCKLHADGLKPTEGRLASCQRSGEEGIAISMHVVSQWAAANAAEAEHEHE